jgi:hypothetical protein
MKFNKWTMGLAAIGVVSLASAAQAEEKMSAIQSVLSSTTISGYVDTSLEWALDRSSIQQAIPFRNGKENGFNLNVVDLTIQKALDESEWAAGYKIELLFGPDAVGYNPSAQSISGQFGYHSGDSNTGTDFAVKNAYVALRTPVGNGIDWKIGVFDSIIGYETFAAGNNPNFTRSWAYAIEPTEHTGILATYRVNDNISIAAGVANTLSSGINTRNDELGNDSYWRKTYMGSIALTAPDNWGFLSGSTLYGGIVGGFVNQGSSATDAYSSGTYAGTEDQVNYYMGMTLNTPVTGLKAGISFDYVTHLGGQAKGVYYNGTYDEYGTKSDGYVVGLYASYQATEKLSLHARAEFGTLTSDYTSPPVYTDGWDNSVIGLTGTVQYDLWKNVISRLEIRWDQMYENGISNSGEVGNHYSYTDTGLGVYANIIYKF